MYLWHASGSKLAGCQVLRLQFCMIQTAVVLSLVLFLVPPPPRAPAPIKSCIVLLLVQLQVLALRGPRLILELPGACFLPDHEPYVSAIFRHILEDPVTLQAAMEAEIRNTLSARGQQADTREGDSRTICSKLLSAVACYAHCQSMYMKLCRA